MRYQCKRCHGGFDWTDPIDPPGILAEAARICPKCRNRKIEKNKKRTNRLRKEKIDEFKRITGN